MYEKNKRKLWAFAENLVKQRYLDDGYTLLKSNFTIRWWEIDLIFIKNDSIIFIEVKSIAYINDIIDYITQQKKTTLKRSIEYFLRRYPTHRRLRFDIVFVKDNNIFELYKDIDL